MLETINRLHNEGLKWKTIAGSFRKTDRALRYFRKRINQPLEKVGRKLLIDDNTLNFLFDWLQSKETATTLEEMADFLNGEFGKRFSEPTIFRALKRKGITWKKTTPHYLEQIPLLGNVSKYTDKVKLLPQYLIIAVDECGFNLEVVPRYNWSFRGSRSFVFKPGKRSINYTLLLCVRNVKEQGVIHWELIEGGAKAKDFHRFITNLKLPTNEKEGVCSELSQKYYLMLDNASIHRAVKACRDLGLSTIKELIASKNIEPIYLVAYSPQLNPVELIFNNVRHNIEKNKPRTFVRTEISCWERDGETEQGRFD